MKKIFKLIVKIVRIFYGSLGHLLMQFHIGHQWSLVPRMWKPFLLERYNNNDCIGESIEEKLLHLKQNLDVNSQKTVDQYLYRIIFSVLANQSGTYIEMNNWLKLFDSEEMDNLKKLSKPSRDSLGSGYLELNDNGLKFLPDTVQKQLEGKDFIDGGAYIGDSIMALIKYKPSRIYAFEPEFTNRQQLIQNCSRLGWKGIVPVAKGLGNSKTAAKIVSNASCSHVKIGGGGQDIKDCIEITDIDSFVYENNINLGVIKLDIEGLELAVIHGAIESIKKYKPVLLISIYHTPDDFFYIKPFIENLDLNYTFLVRKLSPEQPFNETMLIGYVPCKSLT
jgi:FkbM family methyltransferase